VVPDEPVEVLRILRPLRIDRARHALEEVAPAPLVPLFSQPRERLLATLLIGNEPAPGQVEDEALRAIGIRSGKQHAGRRGLRKAQQRRPLAADRVDRRSHVVHPRLDRETARPVGEPDAAQVHDDQPPSFSEAAAEPGEPGELPERVEVRVKRKQHEVARPVADDLVRDGDVAAAGVADVRNLHASILAPWPRRRPSAAS
jgi:hypothetical protein